MADMVTRRFQRHSSIFCLAVAGLLAGCGGPSDEQPVDTQLAVWSEFLGDGELQQQLPFVQSEGVDLYLAIHSTRIGEPALEQLIVQYAATGAEVRAWLLLPDDQGYWPNEHNLDAMREATMRLADWRDAANLPIDWVIFDMEMSLQRTRAVADVIEAEGTVAGLDLVKEGRDPEAFAANRQTLSELVVDLQARGLKVGCVTYPTVLDDMADGDDDIQDQLDVPIYGVPWDEASFMVYQSLIYDLYGSWQGPDIIHSYSQSAVTDFGQRAAVALGIVGSAGIDPVNMSYPDASTLLTDLAAAISTGVTNVSIYSLDGLSQQNDPSEWLERATAPAVPEYFEADNLRSLIQGILDG